MGTARQQVFTVITAGFILAGLLLPKGVLAASTPPEVRPPAAADPSVQLSRAREYLERERAAQQIAEDEEARKASIESSSKLDGETQQAALSFVLQKVETGPSVVLSQMDIDAVVTPHLGQEMTLDDLYALTAELNQLYANKGYVNCRAVLPPQRIHEGVVQIRLVEGRTGSVRVSGNASTREKYVKDRVTLPPGDVANMHQLTRDLQRFNATNDAQLRVVLQAGQEPGTTDYEIVVAEPKRLNFGLYADNGGYKTTGRTREGAFFTYRSLTGQRDNLNLHYIRSKGSDSFGAGYSYPLTKQGLRLDLDYNTNSTEIVKGELEDMHVKGHGSSYGVTLRQPLLVNERKRVEAGLQYVHQKSKTDSHFLNWTWVDDTTKRISPFVSIIHYGDSSVLYQRHSLLKGSWDGLGQGIADSYVNYNFNGMYQKRYAHGQMLQARLSAQWSNEDDLPSGDKFYIGGPSSVRGYEEGYLRGDKGLCASLQYQVPLNEKRTLSAFTFLDYGKIWGTEFEGADTMLWSTGVGLTANWNHVTANLTLGLPMKRHLKYEHVSSTRVEFSLYWEF